MCMACQEDLLLWRYRLEMAVREGEIPPGVEPEDFEIMGLPVPPRRAAPVPSPFSCDVPDKA